MQLPISISDCSKSVHHVLFWVAQPRRLNVVNVCSCSPAPSKDNDDLRPLSVPRMYGEEVVVKWVQPEESDYDAEYLTALLLHEIRVYQRLEELQGVVIPRLVAHGRWHNGKYVLVTSLIQGRHVDVEQHLEDAELAEAGERC